MMEKYLEVMGVYKNVLVANVIYSDGGSRCNTNNRE